MTADSGYSTEFSTSSNIPNIQHEEDIKTYDKTYGNDGAELGVSERNADYAEHSDILLNENQPYDNNAEPENQPYDNNAEPMHPEILYKIRRRCRLFNYIVSMISTAACVGCVIVICLISFCKLPGLKCIIDPPPPPPPPPPGCIVPRGTACNVHYRLSLRNTTEIRLIKETMISKVTFVNGTSLINMEETIFDQNNTITFNVTYKDADIEVSVHILDTQCNHHGNYSILAISDENGFEEAFFSINVIAHCPCQVDLSIASNGEINCYFPNGENATVLIQKVSSDMQTVLLNQSEIIRPFNTPIASGFSASWSNDGTLNIKLKLGLLNCSHEGNYNFNVTMNGTSRMYDVYLHVIDYPQTPVIKVERAGIIEDNDGEISCKAMTGCRKAQFEFELSGTNNDIWDVWRETTQSPSTLTNLGWETNLYATIRKGQEVNVDKRKLRCSYMSNRHLYTSPGLCIGVIPANFCQNKRQCDYQHPYVCNKYITCQTPTYPLERSCSIDTELHFVPIGDCGGRCDWPGNANCSIKDHCG